jgi:hypothetical protein
VIGVIDVAWDHQLDLERTQEVYEPRKRSRPKRGLQRKRNRWRWRK